jgi:hypothetical protein
MSNAGKLPSKDVQAVADRMADSAKRVAKRTSKALGWLSIISEVVDFIVSDMPAYCKDVLRKIGLNYAADEAINTATLTTKISAATGITFTDITNPQAVEADLKSWALARIKQDMGLDVATLENTQDLRQALADLAAQGLAGRSRKVFDARTMGMLRNATRDLLSQEQDFSDGFNPRIRAKRYLHRAAQREWAAGKTREWQN